MNERLLGYNKISNSNYTTQPLSTVMACVLGHSQFNEQNTKIQNLLKTHEMNTCSIYLCALCVTGDDDDPVTHVGTC